MLHPLLELMVVGFEGTVLGVMVLRQGVSSRKEVCLVLKDFSWGGRSFGY